MILYDRYSIYNLTYTKWSVTHLLTNKYKLPWDHVGSWWDLKLDWFTMASCLDVFAIALLSQIAGHSEGRQDGGPCQTTLINPEWRRLKRWFSACLTCGPALNLYFEFVVNRHWWSIYRGLSRLHSVCMCICVSVCVSHHAIIAL